jgi:cyclopropane fatty-acyl-phospholipid synthase-like methyltransferase
VAGRRGVRVHTVTVSVEQHALAQRRLAEAGVADRVRVELCDYRAITAPPGTYDAVVSVEMIEAVGEKYWPAYFSTVDKLLAPGKPGHHRTPLLEAHLASSRPGCADYVARTSAFSSRPPRRSTRG